MISLSSLGHFLIHQVFNQACTDRNFVLVFLLHLLSTVLYLARSARASYSVLPVQEQQSPDTALPPLATVSYHHFLNESSFNALLSGIFGCKRDLFSSLPKEKNTKRFKGLYS